MNPIYKAVFWDFDGTFADTANGIFKSVDHAAKEMGLPVPDEKAHRFFIGPPLSESFQNIFGLSEEESLEAVKKYREFYVQGGMFLLEFYPGIIEFIDELKEADIKIAICSNKPKRFVSAIIEHFNLNDKIDLISCPEHDSQHMMKYQMIDNALSYFGIDKSEALMVGDRYLDMQGAVQSGVDGCGAAYGYGTEKELLESGAKYIVYSVDGIRKTVFGG